MKPNRLNGRQKHSNFTLSHNTIKTFLSNIRSHKKSGQNSVKLIWLGVVYHSHKFLFIANCLLSTWNFFHSWLARIITVLYSLKSTNHLNMNNTSILVIQYTWQYPMALSKESAISGSRVISVWKHHHMLQYLLAPYKAWNRESPELCTIHLMNSSD